MVYKGHSISHSLPIAPARKPHVGQPKSKCRSSADQRWTPETNEIEMNELLVGHFHEAHGQLSCFTASSCPQRPWCRICKVCVTSACSVFVVSPAWQRILVCKGCSSEGLLVACHHMFLSPLHVLHAITSLCVRVCVCPYANVYYKPHVARVHALCFIQYANADVLA